MVMSSHLSPGITLSLQGTLYRVETCIKVTVKKGAPFIRATLRELASGEAVEKNFKFDQELEDVILGERQLEFLYLEEKDYLFLDIQTLDQVLIPADVIGEKAHYLKEGVEIKAQLYGKVVFAIELPTFLELMVAKAEPLKKNKDIRDVFLETGARIQVPPYVDVGDMIRVDPKANRFVQRV